MGTLTVPAEQFCIHGHFYQPDRRNPWTQRIDIESTAAPYPNWNERILDECYRPNAAARIDDRSGTGSRVVSNYERMSWNAGPSLLSWLHEADPWTYRALVAADGAGAAANGGHGPALAQPWVHAILPLAHPDDRRTLVRWGIRDFEHRLGRRPAGMWLPEAAIDTATVECLIDEGIEFTVLAPWQAATAEPVDTSVAHLLEMPSGRRFAAFFYDGALSSAVAFGGLLHDGAAFSRAIAEAAEAVRGKGGLVHLATDGESYGHHHRHGEMALAFAVADLTDRRGIAATNYARHLAEQPPITTVALTDPSSWSCTHGVDRWRGDCGDRVGTEPGWTQAWRRPLRDAIDWLRGELAEAFERGAPFDDPWTVRDGYIEVILSGERDRHLAASGVAESHRARAAAWLESQRHFLQATESSAWFYDDAAGIEAVMALRHAKRAIELASAAGGPDLEGAFVERIRAMQSNVAERGDGAAIWAREVANGSGDLELATIVGHALGAARGSSLDVGHDLVDVACDGDRLIARRVERSTGFTFPIDATVEITPTDVLVVRAGTEAGVDALEPGAAAEALRLLLSRALLTASPELAALATVVRSSRIDLATVAPAIDSAIDDLMRHDRPPSANWLATVAHLADRLAISLPRTSWWTLGFEPT